MSADVPLQQLFAMKKESDDEMFSKDENRMLMDDLNISKDSVRILKKILFQFGIKSNLSIIKENALASIFTGDEEMFAFDRTLSRLNQMQTSEYWNQASRFWKLI